MNDVDFICRERRLFKPFTVYSLIHSFVLGLFIPYTYYFKENQKVSAMTAQFSPHSRIFTIDAVICLSVVYDSGSQMAQLLL